MLTSEETIYLGESMCFCPGNGPSRGGQHSFWFSDAPVCKKENRVDTGSRVYGPRGLCTQGPYTLQGHGGITFTGCGGANGDAPTGVRDNGVPALRCVPFVGSNGG